MRKIVNLKTSSRSKNDKLYGKYDKLYGKNAILRTSSRRLPGLFFIDFGEPYTTIFDHI